MGSYYGGAVLGVDFNNDGLSDLLVGAPLYTVKQDEGLVYVYINKGAVKTNFNIYFVFIKLLICKFAPNRHKNHS